MIRKDYLQGQTVDTVYFGGGTPSLLSEQELSEIMEALHRHFIISPAPEITLEANPDDISASKTAGWLGMGINRLSIGVQSFFEEDLKWMNRAHDSKQALRCIHIAQDTGIDNLSIDLIYGGPTLTDERWIENLELAASLQTPHLSAYALTVEPGAPLAVMIKKNKVAEVSSESQARQFLIMTDLLQSRGYEHYEISNLAIPGKRSAHNSAYWKGIPYIGLGPSAHSFNGESRQWNLSNNALYIQSLNNDEIPFELESLSPTQRFNEYLMTSLRTLEGTDTAHVASTFGDDFRRLLTQGARAYIQKGWLTENNDRLILTREGKLFADGIAADLFRE